MVDRVVQGRGDRLEVDIEEVAGGRVYTGRQALERGLVDRLGGLDWHTMGEGFTGDTQDRDRDIAAARAAFGKACAMMKSGDYDLIVLDEINIALRYDYLSVDEVLDGLGARADRTGVILTGRDAPEALCEFADLVTEMTEVKHPYAAGIKAQRGVDF